jgi:hypothetical protein
MSYPQQLRDSAVVSALPRDLMKSQDQEVMTPGIEPGTKDTSPRVIPTTPLAYDTLARVVTAVAHASVLSRTHSSCGAASPISLPRYRLPVVILNPRSLNATYAAARFASCTTNTLLLGSGKYP